MDARCAVYIPVGPSAEEVDRTADLLASVEVYLDQVTRVIIVDDGEPGRNLQGLLADQSSIEIVCLQHPCGKIPDRKTGGLCAADLVAFEYAQRETASDFVLKLDTDSLLVGRFASSVFNAVQSCHDIGIVGVIGDSFGSNRTYHMIEYLRALMRKILTWPQSLSEMTAVDQARIRRFGVLNESLFRKWQRVRTVIENAAVRAGESIGEYCQGGAYLVTRPLLDAIAAAHYFDDVMAWSEFHVGEDVMMALLCQATGLRLIDMSGVGKPFCVQPGCLPLEPYQLRELRTSVVHSIKGSREREVRQVFSSDRQTCIARA